jgi:HD-GYP domain-containing protein (c-di-GMP phosphodiesterase class II)
MEQAAGISALAESVAGRGYSSLVLDRLARQACQLVESAGSSIFVRDPRVPGTAIAVAACGAHEEMVGNRVRTRDGFRAGVGRHGRRAMLPARWRGEVRGVLSAEAGEGNRFGMRDLELLGELATTAGAALDHAARRDRLLLTLRARVSRLVQSLDSHDDYTAGHSSRVVEWSWALGERLRLSLPDLMELELGALLHDLGKVRVPPEVLRKPARLDDDECELVRRHPVWGAEMLEAVPGLEPVATVVRFHHERWNGTGYPDGLEGDRIPVASRIIAVCDAYHAMTSKRPYRTALPPAAAASELCAGAGAQFDPAIVECFVEILQERGWPLATEDEREAVRIGGTG